LVENPLGRTPQKSIYSIYSIKYSIIASGIPWESFLKLFRNLVIKSIFFIYFFTKLVILKRDNENDFLFVPINRIPPLYTTAYI